MKLNSYTTFSEDFTLACRDCTDKPTYYELDSVGHACRKYVQKAYTCETKTLCEVNGFLLRSVKTSVKTKFEILWNGELLNTYPNEKTAISFFIDFAEITKGKYKKLCKA